MGNCTSDLLMNGNNITIKSNGDMNRDDFAKISNNWMIKKNIGKISDITECVFDGCAGFINDPHIMSDSKYICTISIPRLAVMICRMGAKCTTDENQKEFHRLINMHPLSANFHKGCLINPGPRSVFGRPHIPAFADYNESIRTYMIWFLDTVSSSHDDFYRHREFKLKLYSNVLFAMGKIAFSGNEQWLTLESFIGFNCSMNDIKNVNKHLLCYINNQFEKQDILTIKEKDISTIEEKDISTIKEKDMSTIKENDISTIKEINIT
jgi:hypothetical protein